MTTTIPVTPNAGPADPDIGALMVDAGQEREAADFYTALTHLLRVVQFRDRDRACCYDVSVAQCYGLKAVADNGPLTVNELSAALLLDKSTASRIAAGLEAKGYVRRDPDPDDGRVVRLSTTRAGNELHQRIEGDLQAEYSRLLADFDPEVRAGMTRLLGRLAASFAARVDASGGSCCVIGEK